MRKLLLYSDQISFKRRIFEVHAAAADIVAHGNYRLPVGKYVKGRHMPGGFRYQNKTVSVAAAQPRE